MNQLSRLNGVLLVGDFDDTLYEEDMRITRENAEALTYFIREGGTFTVAIGRARSSFVPHASHIPINTPVILSNSSALHDFRVEGMICGTFLPDRMREDLQQMARVIPTIGFEAYHHDTTYVYQPSAVTSRHLERVGMATREVSIAGIPLSWSKAILRQDCETLLHTQHYLLERWGEHYEVTLSSRVLLELTRKGSSKGGMVRCLARRLGIDAQHIYRVGGNQNDILMLAVSTILFAPANCAPEVKQWGVRILGAYEESYMTQIVDILDHIHA